MKVDKNITEDEAALYDRQIRLWGVDAQKKYYFLQLTIVYYMEICPTKKKFNPDFLSLNPT